MRNKAQVLIISLWILAILGMLAVSTGHRVSLALRLSRYQKDRLNSIYLAKAGVNVAIVELKNDDPAVDSLIDKWADNEEKFNKILVGDNQNEFASVSQIIDEERKININTAPLELLTELLDYAGAADPQDLANNICAWRGDVGASIPDYQPLEYNNKGNKFSNIEELMLVKDFTEDEFNAVKNLISVYPHDGDCKINVNTAPRVVLEILMNTYVKKLQQRNIPIENPDGLLDAMIEFRDKGGIFTDVNLEAGLEQLSDQQKNILSDPVDGLKSKICVNSNYFRIFSQGNLSNSKLTHGIECVFDRSNNQVIYWHEN